MAVNPKYLAQMRLGEIVIQGGRHAHRADFNPPVAPIDRWDRRGKNPRDRGPRTPPGRGVDSL